MAGMITNVKQVAMIKYARLDDSAVRFTNQEAWWFVGGRWKELNSADANHKASLMTEESFNKMFPGLPVLPGEAFK